MGSHSRPTSSQRARGVSTSFHSSDNLSERCDSPRMLSLCQGLEEHPGPGNTNKSALTDGGKRTAPGPQRAQRVHQV